MLHFRSLYSGSTGNSLLVESDASTILIDSGVSAKKIVDALQMHEKSINDVDAILVTHEHQDHVQSLGTLSRKYHIPVYANSKTWDAMPLQKDKIEDSYIRFFENDHSFEIADLMIHPFSTPHDAANPCGFTISHDRKKISIATDLGHMTTHILDQLEHSDFLMLESNYDPEVLKCCSYPYLLKTRISGPNGHLSNHLAGQTISHLLTSGLKQVMLGHLSKESNFPELAYNTILEELARYGYTKDDLQLLVASRHEPSECICVS